MAPCPAWSVMKRLPPRLSRSELILFDIRKFEHF
jgi:hypothetical protein